jgi:hypothetical protein
MKHVLIMKAWLYTMVTVAGLLLLAVPWCAMEQIGEMVVLAGEAELIRSGEATRMLQEGEVLYIQDIVQARAGAQVEIELRDGSRLRISDGVRLDLSEYQFAAKPSTFLQRAWHWLSNMVCEIFSQHCGCPKGRKLPSTVGVQG